MTAVSMNEFTKTCFVVILFTLLAVLTQFFFHVCDIELKIIHNFDAGCHNKWKPNYIDSGKVRKGPFCYVSGPVGNFQFPNLICHSTTVFQSSLKFNSQRS